jgi:DNA polymerase III epsilon subunit-like protein
MKLLIFDTETTGLPPNRGTPLITTARWPYVVQLSYMIYDTNTNIIINNVDTLIKLPPGICVPEDSTKIHGITHKMCDEQGCDIKEVLLEFNNALLHVDKLIGHNIQFDKSILTVEYIRSRLTNNFTYNNIPIMEFCTMFNSIELCSLYRTNNSGRTYKKYPKLVELHEKLFNETPSGLHNAMADVIVCLRCYYKMQFNSDIFECSPDLVALCHKYQIKLTNIK